MYIATWEVPGQVCLICCGLICGIVQLTFRTNRNKSEPGDPQFVSICKYLRNIRNRKLNKVTNKNNAATCSQVFRKHSQLRHVCRGCEWMIGHVPIYVLLQLLVARLLFAPWQDSPLWSRWMWPESGATCELQMFQFVLWNFG
jgi:hypothetical protein